MAHSKGHGGGKGVKVSTFKGAGATSPINAMIGGPSNIGRTPSAKKGGKNYNKGGRVK
jgi:hypothetical protein